MFIVAINFIDGGAPWEKPQTWRHSLHVLDTTLFERRSLKMPKWVIWSHKLKKTRQCNGQKGQKDNNGSTKCYTENWILSVSFDLHQEQIENDLQLDNKVPLNTKIKAIFCVRHSNSIAGVGFKLSRYNIKVSPSIICCYAIINFIITLLLLYKSSDLVWDITNFNIPSYNILIWCFYGII
jgi:hypothetical protein